MFRLESMPREERLDRVNFCLKRVGLETFPQQMGFFSSLSEKDQVQFLMSGVVPRSLEFTTAVAGFLKTRLQTTARV